jgi:hypothetical protein
MSIRQHQNNRAIHVYPAKKKIPINHAHGKKINVSHPHTEKINRTWQKKNRKHRMECNGNTKECITLTESPTGK